MASLLQERLEKAFPQEQAQLLAEVITERYDNLVQARDFNELKHTVERIAKAQEELAEVQKKTEQRVDTLTQRVDTLAQKVEELAEAQKRTDQRLEELAEAQKRTEQRVDTLAQKVEELAETMKLGFQKVNEQISALGSRWGIKNENMLRNTLHNLLKDLGYTVSRGYYGDREIDILIRNGEHILLEVTSAAKRKDVRSLNLSAEDYYSKNKVKPRLVLAAVYISPVVMREIVDSPHKIEVYSGDEDEEGMFE